MNKLVTDLSNKEDDDNEQETTTTKTEVFAFASRYKAKAKPKRPTSDCSSTRTIHILEIKWLDIETGTQFDQAYPVAIRINSLLRHDISCGTKDNEKECESNARPVSLFAKRFATGQWSFLGPGSEKKWYSVSADSPQGEWDRIAEKMML